MALTDKKKAFAQAKFDGADNKQAAVFAGYSHETASQAGSRLAKDEDVIKHIERLGNAKAVKASFDTEPKKAVTRSDVEASKKLQDPLEFLESVYTDPVEDMALRVRAAQAALPYIHGKIAEKGKKETKADEAKQATTSGKYASLSAQLRS